MGLSRKFRRRTELEQRMFDAQVTDKAISIAKQAIYSADKRMKEREKEICVESATILVGTLAGVVIDENWAKLTPKATRIEVFAKLLKEAWDGTESLTTVDGLTDKQKEAGKIVATAFGLPWRL